jgi:hypothetical protein
VQVVGAQSYIAILIYCRTETVAVQVVGAQSYIATLIYCRNETVAVQVVGAQSYIVHLSVAELKQLLCKLLEPNPSHRLPLMDVEIHPWVTCDAKMPFYPFHAFPRDKLLKSQVFSNFDKVNFKLFL